MKSLFNPEHNQEIIARINKLTPASTPQWGKMNVSQALTHCQRPLQVAYGELKLKRVFIGFLFGKMMKKKLLSPAEFGKNMPTDKHFIVNDERDFTTEKHKLISMVQKFSTKGASSLTKEPHPFFGPLTSEEWELLNHKHLHHHLSQFGV